MNQGMELQALSQKLINQAKTRRDYLVPVSKLQVTSDGKLAFNNNRYQLNDWSLSQISEFSNVPIAYARRLSNEFPALLSDNLNHGLKKEQSNTRLVRTNESLTQAFLSNKYQIFDAHNILGEAILPVLLRYEQFKVLSSHMGEQKVYLKAINMDTKVEIAPNDFVYFGLSWSTSDVGAGASTLDMFAFRSICLNGCTFGMNSIRKVHIGKSLIGDGLYEMLSDQTKIETERMFYNQIRDVLGKAMSQEFFEAKIRAMKDSTQRDIQNKNLEEVVELSMKQVGLSGEDTKVNLLHALAQGNQGAGLTQWGLANSFTTLANQADLAYEKSDELERAGGKILELSESQWKNIAC